MRQYKRTSLFLIPFLFLLFATVDKIVAQTDWGNADLLFVFLTSGFGSITFYLYKNKL